MRDILFLVFYLFFGFFLYYVEANVIIWVISFIVMFLVNKSIRGNKVS